MIGDAQIRMATAPDAEAITSLAMRAKAHWGYDEAFMAACVGELTYTPARIASLEVRLISEGVELKGFVAVDIRDGEVEAIFVEPATIGGGYGRRLMDEAIAIGRANSLNALHVDSDPHAEGFYRRLGFEPIGKSPSGSIPGRFLPRLCLAL